MNSISFPHMFNNSSSTNIVKDKEASTQSLKLTLSCEKGELLGDPTYGIDLRKFYYEQNSYILEDLVIDEIYTAIKFFTPQVIVDRRDIKIIRKNNKLSAKITGINQLDYTTDMYELVLFQEEER